MEITLSQCQEKAAQGFQNFLKSDDPHMIISGFAGSGKSFLVQYLAQLVQDQIGLMQLIDPQYVAPFVHYTATTNKAAAVLGSLVQGEVTTIHSLLGLTVSTDYKTGQEKLTQKRRAKSLRDSIIIIDEASMIGSELMAHIKQVQRDVKNCRIIYIGDPYQMPPVMENPCRVFQETENHYFLDEIQRQVAGSPIIQLSAQYRAVLDDPDLEWPEIPHDGQTIFRYDTEEDFKQAIQASMGHPHNIQQHKVVAWKNSKVQEYNAWIRRLHGYTDDYNVGEIVMTNKPLMDGDAVVASTDTFHTISGIDRARILNIEGYTIALQLKHLSHRPFSVFQPKCWSQAKVLMKQFARDKNWRHYFHIKQQWADLRAIHALTCHKAQGSTYKEVFVDLEDISRNNNWKEAARLAYVAVTRASDRLHIYGTLKNRYPSKNTDLMEAFADAPIFQ
jgi:ATP-dependent exoDNAse (exonuclease V) alpha subunit